MLTHRQLLGWMRYYAEQPFGADVDALEHALTRQVVAAAFGGAKDTTLRDFLLFGNRETVVSDGGNPDETMARLARQLGASREEVPSAVEAE